MDLVRRVEGLILKPKEEWKKIRAEKATISGLFTSYVLILAAIPPVAEFIGKVLIGQRIPFEGLVRWSIGRALGKAILSYVSYLAIAYLWAFSIKTLAPNFSSIPSMIHALKLTIFSMTPIWLSGILYIIPSLGILSLIAYLYAFYILFLGFETPLMETPKESTLSYTGISIVIGIILFIVFFVIQGIFAVRYLAI